VLLSGNGSEFEAGFAKTIQHHGIRRWFAYPKSPGMNARCERFNRTLQESFVDYHEDLLFTDLTLFNPKLADWLIFDNTERPHHPLGLQSPVFFLIQRQPECQRYWTHTNNLTDTTIRCYHDRRENYRHSNLGRISWDYKVELICIRKLRLIERSLSLFM
jgi:hypothetical protein